VSPSGHHRGRTFGGVAEISFNKPLTVTQVTLYSSVIRKSNSAYR